LFSLFLHILYLCVLLSIVSMKHDWCCCMWRRTWQATTNCLHKKVFFAKHKKMNSLQKNVFQQKKIGRFPPAIIYFLFRQKSVCWINVLKCRGKSFSTKLPCFNLFFENSKKIWKTNSHVNVQSLFLKEITSLCNFLKSYK